MFIFNCQYFIRKFSGHPHIKLFIVAIWCGEAKPTSVNSYFSLFVTEFKKLFTNGIDINNHFIRIKIRCFICDTPARSFAKGSFNFRVITIIQMYEWPFFRCRKLQCIFRVSEVHGSRNVFQHVPRDVLSKNRFPTPNRREL